MATQNIGGYSFETLTRAEAKEDLHAALGHHFSQISREALRGMKIFKLPAIIGTASGTSLKLPLSGGAEPTSCGPQQGYVWRIGRITVASSGNDAGAVSLYQGSDPTVFDQTTLVDNTLQVGKAYYPGTRGMFLWGGEQIFVSLVSVSGNAYRLSGLAVEVPAEMVGKIL